MMSLINQAADLFLNNIADSQNLEPQKIGDALQRLLPTSGGDIDFSQLISQFTQGNLGNLVNSFLGDGQNMNMMASQVISLLGEDKIINFATSLGIDPNKASEVLSNIIPDLIDKNSQGGNLTQLAGKILSGFFS